ncbi:MAG: hypothetical protein GOVbin962_68 [Prokaryotic dsDNA virus sp.]|nr:MAG: hypothetical protein GOVbin962_68 [Prokaryotic dsDNA virus sp.]|tara:strand:+ start:21886 stop:22167 length:282 start_codon:yes stop_codon:yes gene_type:complete
MKMKSYDIEDFDEYTCMYNSYLVLTGKSSHEELLEKDLGCAFIFNPTRKYIPMEDDVYDILIEYFNSVEQYEICKELRDSKTVAKLLINFQSF